jgi:hypothetical protein
VVELAELVEVVWVSGVVDKGGGSWRRALEMGLGNRVRAGHSKGVLRQQTVVQMTVKEDTT